MKALVIFVLPVLAIFTTQVLTAMTFASNDLTNDNVAQELFENLDRKSAPLYSCRGWIDGIKWRVPHTMQCPLVSTTLESRLVGITFWHEDITMAPVKAYECYAVEESLSREWFFFGGHNEKKSERKIDIKLSDCILMVNTMKTPDGSPLERIQDDFLGTTRKPEVEWQWASFQSNSVINYYYIGLLVAVSNIDSIIQTNTKLIETCSYQKGYCFSDLGVLVWKVTGYYSCRLKKGQSTVCLLTEGRMSCPEQDIAITDITSIDACNMTFGTSAQGLLFTQDDQWTQHLNITIDNTLYAESAILKIKETGRYPSSRKRRSIPAASAMSAAQFNGKLQYLYQTVKENINISIQQIHNDACRSNKNQLETLRILAQGGSVSLLVRVLLGDNTYRARMNGDILSVFKCQEIYHYMMVPRNSCIVEWPIVFMEDNEKHTAYVSPLSHEITYFPTTVPCPGQDFYFDTGKSVVLLTNKTLIANVPTLPKPIESYNYNNLPTLSFKTPGVYNLAETSGGETLIELIRDMQRRYRIDEAIRTEKEGGTLRSDQIDVLGTVRRFTIDPIKNMIAGILSSLFSTFILAVVVVMIFKKLPFFKKKISVLTRKCFGLQDNGKDIVDIEMKGPVSEEEYLHDHTPSAPEQYFHNGIGHSYKPFSYGEETKRLYPAFEHDEEESYDN